MCPSNRGKSSLFDEAEATAQDPAGDADALAGIAIDGNSDQTKTGSDLPFNAQSKSKVARGKRAPLPASLPRIDIIHDVPESERICACGTPMVLIGCEISEQLDIVPMQLRVLRTLRNKYACPDSLHAPVIAPMPAQLLPKSNASADLITMIATLKYIDGVPLARTERKFEGFGAPLPRQTQARWMVKVGGNVLQPLVNLVQDALYEHDLIYMDETSVQVLKGTGKAASSNNYMWVRTGGPPSKPVRLFHYAPGRGSEVANELLAGWKGYLMVDGYSGYGEATQTDDVHRLGCWAHARRYFVEAQTAAPKAAKNKASHAGHAIALIGKLYGIERVCKASDDAQRLEARQTQAKPILDALHQWLETIQPSIAPKSALGKALTYLNNQWSYLIRYVERGDLPIDNNQAENAIRPFVIGRKNWLFSDTVAGAKASANFYTLIETAKANGLEPHTWLRHVLNNIASAKTVDDYDALMPWNVEREGKLTITR